MGGGDRAVAGGVKPSCRRLRAAVYTKGTFAGAHMPSLPSNARLTDFCMLASGLEKGVVKKNVSWVKRQERRQSGKDREATANKAARFAGFDRISYMTTCSICTHAASALLCAATCACAATKKAQRQLTQARS